MGKLGLGKDLIAQVQSPSLASGWLRCGRDACTAGKDGSHTREECVVFFFPFQTLSVTLDLSGSREARNTSHWRAWGGRQAACTMPPWDQDRTHHGQGGNGCTRRPTSLWSSPKEVLSDLRPVMDQARSNVGDQTVHEDYLLL